MAKSHWRFFLSRWHRRVGVAAALFVLLLSITGVLLNHSTTLGLDRAPLENRWLRSLYGVPAEAEVQPGLVHRLPAGELAVQGGQLRLGERIVGECPRLVGVVEQGGQVLAACSDRLLLLTPDGELIDQADALRGIPDGLSAVSRQGDAVLLRQGEATFSVDLGDLSVAPAGPAAPVPAPAMAGSTEAVDDIDWERVLLDVHSGRLFGRYGPWFMDAMAVLFITLAVSGLVMAWRRRPRQP